MIGLAGAPAEDFGQKSFPSAGIANEHDIGALADEVEIEQVQDLGFDLQAGLVMLEVELVDAVLGVEPGMLEASLDGPLVA